MVSAPTSKSQLSRRRFLSATGTASVHSVSGCLSRVSSSAPDQIDWTGEAIQLDGLEHHHFFGGANHPVIITLRQEAITADETMPASPIPFYLLLHHREGLRTDATQVSLYAPPRDGSSFDAAVYLGPPASEHWPAMTLSRTDEWTVFDATELGQPDVFPFPGR